jgi:hypothetical protein
MGTAAAATDMKAYGEFAFAAQWLDNTDFLDTEEEGTSEDDFSIFQRMRLFFDLTASESLKGVLGLEIGSTDWGVASEGGDLDTDGVIVEVKHAYMDFLVPNTDLSFRIGLQPLAFPGTMGSPIFDWDVAGLLASYRINDTFGATFGWIRPFDSDNDATREREDVLGENVRDEVDALALILPIAGDGWSATPWAAYAMAGENASQSAVAAGDANTVSGYFGLVANQTTAQGDRLDAWWVGSSFTLDLFDPFILNADVIYGAADGANATDEGGAGEREGWYVDAALDFRTDFATPGVFAIYSTGEDEDLADGSERIPTLGGRVTATSFGLDGAETIIDDTGDGILTNDATIGLWMVGAALKRLTFVDGLSHTLRVAYGQGTTDRNFVRRGYGGANGRYLTEEDSFWEVNFDSSYSIYENLSAFIEFGYLSLDLDEGVWNGQTNNWGTTDVNELEDAWKLAMALRYRF